MLGIGKREVQRKHLKAVPLAPYVGFVNAFWPSSYPLLFSTAPVLGNARILSNNPTSTAFSYSQVSKEAVVAASYFARSLEGALSSPATLPCTRNSRRRRRSASLGSGDSDWSNVPSPGISSLPWGLADEGCDLGDRVVDDRDNSPDFGGGWSGATNNWASAIPLPRLALLSGLTTLRLNVSLAGVSVRIPARGLLINGEHHQEGVGSESRDEEVPLSAECSPGGAHESARRQRARRCVRRIARQLVARIHPVGTSPGFRQACRLFGDEMVAMGYGKAASGAVLRALREAHARTRDPEEQDGDKDTLGPERTTTEPPGTSTTATPEDREDVKELIQAGMVALPSINSEDSPGAGGNAGEPSLLDIISVEVCEFLYMM